ncbi:MAG: HepT-like ribonuclease domain-containing protein [Patescibacteria group bacterium]
MKINIRVLHIRDAIKRIQKATKDVSCVDLSHNDVLLRAVVYDVMVIGEASKNLPDDLTTTYSDIPWKNIAGTRDKLVHDYFDIDVDIIWNIITHELPKLKIAIDDYISKNPELTIP